MDKVRDIFLYFVAAMTMFAMLGAVYQAFNGQKGSALTLGTLFLVGTLIVFIPQLEVIKTLGVEARLREVKETLTEAQVIVNRLNRLSTINARVSYMLMGWGNRMDGPTAKEKQSIIEEVDKQLSEMKITPEERASITRPYVQLIGIDLYYIYVQVMERYATVKRQEMMRRYEQDKNDESRAAAQRITDAEGEWMAGKGGGPFKDINSYVFEDVMKRATPVGWLNTQEQASARNFANQLVEMFKACEKKGGYTPEAADFNDKYRDLGGIDAKMKELFGVSYK